MHLDTMNHTPTVFRWLVAQSYAVIIYKFVVEVITMIVLISYKSLFFFFKQKTAYEILIGLVGSEMCIRDSSLP